MGKLYKRLQEEIQRASRIIYESETLQSMAPQINGSLRNFALRVPEQISECSGIVLFGKRIRSIVFTTDVAVIRNCNADAVFAVYPYTPQPIINEMLIHAADVPVFTGVGGGLTQGKRVVNLAMFSEMQGAAGVVVNAPTSDKTIRELYDTIDIPIVATMVNAEGVREKVQHGAEILNVAAGSQTAQVVAKIRAIDPNIPIIATGGPTEESITETIRAGANAIIWSPPTNGEVFKPVMEAYRKGEKHP